MPSLKLFSYVNTLFYTVKVAFFMTDACFGVYYH
jgi:hypothetical protein